MKTIKWSPIVRSLINTVLNMDGYTLHSVHDGEERFLTSDPDAATKMICSVDESHVYFRVPSGNIRWMFIVLGNRPEEIVCDYIVDEGFDKAVDAHYEKYVNT